MVVLLFLTTFIILRGGDGIFSVRFQLYHTQKYTILLRLNYGRKYEVHTGRLKVRSESCRHRIYVAQEKWFSLYPGYRWTLITCMPALSNRYKGIQPVRTMAWFFLESVSKDSHL